MSEEEKRDVQLQNRNFKQAEVVRNRWSVVLAPEHRKSDLDDPRFWANIANQLQSGDIVEVRTEEETAYGEFIVVECSRLHAKVQQLSWHELGVKSAVSVDPEYAYMWRGTIQRHCVVRIADKHNMAENLPSKAACLEWIKNYQKQAA